MYSGGTYTGSQTTINSASMYHFFRRAALETLEANLVMAPLGMVQDLPKGFGKTVKFIRYPNLALVTGTLTEGTMPAAVALSSGSVTAAVSQYGRVVQLSDLAGLSAADDIEKAIRERVAYNAARSLDRLILTHLKSAASASNIWANGTAASAVSTALCALDFLTAAITFRKNDVQPAKGEDFVAVVHPAVAYDIMSETTANACWADVHKYTNNKPILNGEIGRLYGVRVVESSQIITGADGKSSATLYYNMALGKDAFATTTLGSGGGKGFELIIMPFGSGGATGDALKQVMSIGWKSQFACKYLGAMASPVSNPHLAIRMIGKSSG